MTRANALIRFGRVGLCLAMLFCLGLPAQAAPLRLSGPPVADSLPLIYMVRGGLMHQGTTIPASLVPWFSPDQMRAMILGGQTDVVISTISTLATLHAKGIPVRVAALAAPPGWLVSRKSLPKSKLNSMDSLRNSTVMLPFGPGEMPVVMFRSLMEKHGLQAEKDIELRYSSAPMEAVQMLLLGKADHAYLSEPTATMAVERGVQAGTPLYKTINVNQTWAEAFPDTPQLVTAVAVVGDKAANATLAAAVGNGFASGCAWAKAHSNEALQQAESLYPALAAQMQRVKGYVYNPTVVDYASGKRSALFLLQRMYDENPASIGGRMPDETFWIPLP